MTRFSIKIAKAKKCRPKTFFTKHLGLSESKNPSSIKYEVIGTRPLWFVDGQPLATFVRLNDGKDSAQLLLVVWWNDLISGDAIMTESDDKTFRTPFLARSTKNFVGFHAGLEKSTGIKVKTDQKGNAVAIEFQTARGIIVARRVNDPWN